MYQFTKTTVINSAKALDYNGNVLVNGNGNDVAMYAGSANKLTVAKAGTFLKDNVTAAYKRPYTAGVKEVAKITVPSGTAGDIVKLTVEVSLSQSTQSEYTNYSIDFKKPQTVEVLFTTDAATTAGLLVTQLNTLKNRFGQNMFIATRSSAEITLTAREDVQRFSSVLLYKVEYDTVNTISQMKETVIATGSVTTSGKVGFGDDAYMAKSIMLPTAENVRYFGESKGERPVLGGNYTQYTLHYTVAKDHDLGIVSGSVSKTTHVFYVKSDLVTGFEAALVGAGIIVDTIGAAVTGISITSGNLDISNVVGGTAYVTTYTTTPSGVTGAIFTLDTAASTVAGTADWTKVAVTNAGVISLTTGHGLAAADKIALDVTIDGYSTTVEITLQA